MAAAYVEPNHQVLDLQIVKSMRESLKSASESMNIVQVKYVMLVFFLSKDGKSYQQGQIDIGIM